MRAGERRSLSTWCARTAAWSLLTATVLLFGSSSPARASTASPKPFDETLGAGSLLPSVVRDGRVDYDTLAANRAALDRSLRSAAEETPDRLAWTGEYARIAFYINVYNLATLDLVALERARRGAGFRSIQEISAAWSRPRWKLAGVERTLDEIEHEILRKEFREPRVHMALVCASISCPALRSEPYEARILNRQLDDASRVFVNDPTRNEFTPRDGRIRISKIFDWYGGDFVGVYRDSALERMYGEKEGAVLAFASRYLPAETVASLRAKKVKIDYLPYDWGLNAAPAAKKP